MSVDTKHALRHVLCRANPSAMQNVRWGAASVDITPSRRSSQANSFPRRRGKEGIGAISNMKTLPSQPPTTAGDGVNLRRMKCLSTKFSIYVELKHQHQRASQS